MYESIFHPSWWLPWTVAFLGIGLVIFALKNGQKLSLKLGLVGLVSGLGWWGVAALVATPVEQALAGTSAMVQAVVNRDVAALDQVLHPNATVERWNRKSLLSGATASADRFGIKSAYITGKRVEQLPPDSVVVRFRVLAELDARAVGAGGAIASDWSFEFVPENASGLYKLKVIRLINVAEKESLTAAARAVLNRDP